MYRSGRGVAQDKVEAVNWYRKAAKQRYPNAMFNLGSAYYNGDGVGIDDITAYAWFLLAENFGSPPAAQAVKHSEQNVGNPQLVRSVAFEKIGDMYQQGDDLPQSSTEAVNWYRKAAVNGTLEVQVKLASLLLRSPQNGASNYTEALGLCEKAAKQHYSPGAYCAGKLYEEGLGVGRNLSTAASWFSEAATMGNAAGTLRLGQMYWKGEGLKQDKIAAYEFIYLASTSNLAEAKQERELLEKELTVKEQEKGKSKAVAFLRRHPALVLRKPSTAN